MEAALRKVAGEFLERVYGAEHPHHGFTIDDMLIAFAAGAQSVRVERQQAARAYGSAGGTARARTLSKDELRRIALLASEVAKLKRDAVRRRAREGGAQA